MSRKKAKKNTDNKPKKLLIEEIFDLFKKNNNLSFNYKQISSRLNINDTKIRKVIQQILVDLEQKEIITSQGKGKYKLASSGNYVSGVLEVTSKKTGFVITDDLERDVFIAEKNLNRALHGDTVSVYLFPSRKNSRPEGSITEVLSREKTQFVGTIQKNKKFAFLVPDNSKIHVDLFIPLNKLNGAETDDKAVAIINDWPENTPSPYGEIVSVLGQVGSNDAEILAVLAEHELPSVFPAHVEKAAKNINQTISEDEIKKRKDFRNVTTFTIDPDDAKDFDDALSIKKKGDLWEIGVHIADVSHYVTENGVIDNEAYSRATSIYLVDRVIPMLPEVLSNQVCSLRPHEEKLCFSAIFLMDDNAQIVNESFGRTVIKSNHRFTYEDAQTILEKKDDSAEFGSEILVLDKLAKKMRAKRFESGALNIISEEVKFRLDDEGNPVGVFTKVSKDAHKLIEEFMLIANKRVAAVVGKITKGNPPNPFIFRVHDLPDPEKLETLMMFVKKFGHELDIKTPMDAPQSINKLLNEISASKEHNVIQQFAIRSMAKAVYSVENIGHYGLGFDFYTHFTSPIRRYPDLVVHRILQRYLDNNIDRSNTEYLTSMCKHASGMEKKAADAERTSIKFKQVQYLMDQIDEVFPGVISGITEWGIYIELTESKCEGMVRLKNIKDDKYYFDEANYRVVGSKYKSELNLGDEVMIRVLDANLLKKQIDFEFIEKVSY